MKRLEKIVRKVAERRAKIVGYFLLAICTILFAKACVMGKQSAAVQLLGYCTALLLVL